MIESRDKIIVEDLVNYHVKDFIIDNELFQQVYEEILTLAYWVNGFQPHNILEIGHRGSTFHILSQLSTGKKVALDWVDNGLSIRSHYMMYGQDFKLFIGDSQTEETRDKVKEFCPQYDLIFIDFVFSTECTSCAESFSKFLRNSANSLSLISWAARCAARSA